MIPFYKNFWFYTLLMGVITMGQGLLVRSVTTQPLWAGGIFVAGSAIVLGVQWRNARITKWLKVNGQIVEAEFTGVARHQTSLRNDYVRFRVHAQANGQNFKSDMFYFDPTPQLIPKQTIVVRVDPDHPTHYWMDLSFL